MDERLKFVARLLDGDKMAVLCRKAVRLRFGDKNRTAGTSRPIAVLGHIRIRATKRQFAGSGKLT
jgi:hypothetical protein